MRAAMSQINLSARGYHRILKLARTIADLAGCEEIQSVHLTEALHASRSSEVDDGLTGKSLPDAFGFKRKRALAENYQSSGQPGPAMHRSSIQPRAGTRICLWSHQATGCI